MNPYELASLYTAHDLLHIASEAMEAIAKMADDDLDVSSDEDEELIHEIDETVAGDPATELPRLAEHLEEEVSWYQ
jgi:hypothetical protein